MVKMTNNKTSVPIFPLSLMVPNVPVCLSISVHLRAVFIFSILSIILLQIVVSPGNQLNLFAQIQRSFTDYDFNTWYSNPSSYIGTTVNITGKIFNVPPIGIAGVRSIQIHHGGDINTNILVFFRGTETIFSVNDCVRIVGTSDKPQEFTNSFGAVLTTPSINAHQVEKIDCSLAINPSIRTIFVQEVQQQDQIMLL